MLYLALGDFRKTIVQQSKCTTYVKEQHNAHTNSLATRFQVQHEAIHKAVLSAPPKLGCGAGEGESVGPPRARSAGRGQPTQFFLTNPPKKRCFGKYYPKINLPTPRAKCCGKDGGGQHWLGQNPTESTARLLYLAHGHTTKLHENAEKLIPT